MIIDTAIDVKGSVVGVDKDDYVGRLLGGSGAEESKERAELRSCAANVFDGKSDIEVVRISGDLIEFIRDVLMSSFAGIRRAAVVEAKRTMSTDQVAQSTGLSKVTVSRMFTENRNY